jgi:hypothetical protein
MSPSQLRDVLVSDIGTAGQAQIDIASYLSRATLDIIGLAGFGYSFNALTSSLKEPNELSQAFKTVFRLTRSGGWLEDLMTLFPVLRNLIGARFFYCVLQTTLIPILAIRTERACQGGSNRHEPHWSTTSPRQESHACAG